jgi:hypothetical protein
LFRRAGAACRGCAGLPCDCRSGWCVGRTVSRARGGGGLTRSRSRSRGGCCARDGRLSPVPPLGLRVVCGVRQCSRCSSVASTSTVPRYVSGGHRALRLPAMRWRRSKTPKPTSSRNSGAAGIHRAIRGSQTADRVSSALADVCPHASGAHPRIVRCSIADRSRFRLLGGFPPTSKRNGRSLGEHNFPEAIAHRFRCILRLASAFQCQNSSCVRAGRSVACRGSVDC